MPQIGQRLWIVVIHQYGMDKNNSQYSDGAKRLSDLESVTSKKVITNMRITEPFWLLTSLIGRTVSLGTILPIQTDTMFSLSRVI